MQWRKVFALQIQVKYDSSSDEAPYDSRSIYLREIQIDHNDILQRHSALAPPGGVCARPILRGIKYIFNTLI